MTSLVPILGLLPAALATSLGSDVQRPLATVITCGLSGSAPITLFITPVFYRIFVPPLRESPSAHADAPRLTEPLPDASAIEIIGLLEYLHQRDDKDAVVRIAADTNREFAHVVFIIKAAELLGFASTPLHMVILTPEGRQFVEATPEQRKALWRERLLTLRLFREVYQLLQQRSDHAVDSDFVLETIVMFILYEHYERVFNPFIRWRVSADSSPMTRPVSESRSCESIRTRSGTRPMPAGRTAKRAGSGRIGVRLGPRQKRGGLAPAAILVRHRPKSATIAVIRLSLMEALCLGKLEGSRRWRLSRLPA